MTWAQPRAARVARAARVVGWALLQPAVALILLCLAHAGGSGNTSVAALELTPDLRCSACAVSAKVVEDSILEFTERRQQQEHARSGQATPALSAPASMTLAAAVQTACAAVPKAAVAGLDGKREFIDFRRAMRKEERGSGEMGLVNVKFTRDVTMALRNFCAQASSAFFEHFDLVVELRTKRTLEDLDVLARLCFRQPDPHCPQAKKPQRTAALAGAGDNAAGGALGGAAKEKATLVHKQRRDAFAENRPYLFGRVPATATGGYCETCFAVVDEVHKVLSQDVEDARRQVERGVRRDVQFDVAGAVGAVCSLGNDDYERFSPELRRFCEAQLLARPEAVAVFARHFSGAVPAAANLFRRKGQICGELQPECRTLDLTDGTARSGGGGGGGGSGGGRLPTQCAACAAYVGDVWSLLRRWSSAGAYFLSPAHVERVLEDSCGAAPGNHPAAVARQVDAVCEALMEEFDVELLGMFVGFRPEFERQRQAAGEAGGAAAAALDALTHRICGQLAGACQESDLTARGTAARTEL